MRALERTLAVLAVVPVVAGTLSVLLGSHLIDGDASASVESELRFYGAFYAGFGLVLAWVSREVAARGAALLAACGVLLLGAVGRVVAWVDVGRPEPTYLVLLGIEVVLGLGLPAWHRAASRRR